MARSSLQLGSVPTRPSFMSVDGNFVWTVIDSQVGSWRGFTFVWPVGQQFENHVAAAIVAEPVAFRSDNFRKLSWANLLQLRSFQSLDFSLKTSYFPQLASFQWKIQWLEAPKLSEVTPKHVFDWRYALLGRTLGVDLDAPEISDGSTASLTLMGHVF